MGILNEMLFSFNTGRQKAQQEAMLKRAAKAKDLASSDVSIAEMLGPAFGRTVNFRITTPIGSQLCLSQLASIAKAVDAEFEVCGNLAVFTFSNEAIANAFRSGWST